ncbi:uncharacterized protein BCR38DRAFT_300109, partial [Pseudomassariella vexata]
MLTHLLQVLENCVESVPEKGIFFYDSDHLDHPAFISYHDLLRQAKERAQLLLNHHIVSPGEIVILHLETHIDYVTWFWSVLVASGVPVISTSLPTDPTVKTSHLEHLQKLLKTPKVLTTKRFSNEFTLFSTSDLFLVEELISSEHQSHVTASTTSTLYGNGGVSRDTYDLAFLMLTSGSTGFSKAVEQHHRQVIASSHSKMEMMDVTSEDIFFNWIDFDHVSAVAEIHIHAIVAQATQVHVAPTIALHDPLLWLKIIDHHAVSYTFSPNFFLAAVCRAVENASPRPALNLSKLRAVISGGEANVVSTGLAFNAAMRSLGAVQDVLVPAFGMTETCGGCSYNREFPDRETRLGLQFCSSGKTISALQIRITDETGKVLDADQEGNLEVSGPALVNRYFNDVDNTTKAFTQDGWFKTGDRGCIDAARNLTLSGRAKDMIKINGVNYFSHGLEAALEKARLDGLTPSYTAAFSTWPTGSDSEELVILFLPTSRALEDRNVLVHTIDRISETATLYCTKAPINVIPLPVEMLPKTSL